MGSHIDLFTPELYSAILLKTKEKIHVFANIANRNYEGEIKNKGDRVRIRQVGNIDVSDYTKNSTTVITNQFLSDAETYLDIDQAKYFSFYVDDVDSAQSDLNFMSEAMRKSAYKLNDTADAYLAGLYTQAGITRNTSSSPVDMTSTNIMNECLIVGQNLDEQNAGRDNRFMIAPPWFFTKAAIAGIKTLTDNNQATENGYVGREFGFKFYMSNNVNKDSTAWADTKLIAGIEGESFTFAEQVVKIEALRSPDFFGNLNRGLHVYGGKVIQPMLTACLFADYTDET